MAGTIVLLAGVGATVATVGSFSGCVVALKRLMVGVLARSAYARLPNVSHSRRDWAARRRRVDQDRPCSWRC